MFTVQDVSFEMGSLVRTRHTLVTGHCHCALVVKVAIMPFNVKFKLGDMSVVAGPHYAFGTGYRAKSN